MSEEPLVQTASATPPATLADMIVEWEERLYQERNAERVARQHDETFAKWHEGRADTYDRIIDEAKRYAAIETVVYNVEALFEGEWRVWFVRESEEEARQQATVIKEKSRIVRITTKREVLP